MSKEEEEGRGVGGQRGGKDEEEVYSKSMAGSNGANSGSQALCVQRRGFANKNPKLDDSFFLFLIGQTRPSEMVAVCMPSSCPGRCILPVSYWSKRNRSLCFLRY